ncbi:MAG TPA: PEP-CTERM sorting domain-containing protein [Tepidisphaeraceae bacterium]|nr:PEP-CTERM sorting domain-containing protein [Tepidisphaeraceae bacterium]
MMVHTTHRPATLRQRCQSTAALALAAACTAALPAVSLAQNVSARPFLQVFEASYKTLEKRAPDIFAAGYGDLWIPPMGRADLGNFSVGYDQYDRFDLGRPGNPTLYGTETGARQAINVLRRANHGVTMDLIWNHNGYSGTSTNAAERAAFAAAGGDPGFVYTLPSDVDGDFHGAFEGGDLNGRLAGLIDIAQNKNYQYIRSPVELNNPSNIPAGTVPAFGRLANVPTESNRKYYQNRNRAPDRIVFDPSTGQANIPVWDYTADVATTGTPVTENGLGYLMRNTQWLVQEIGVDGFRVDAAKHMPTWVMGFLDRAVYRSNPRLRLDGSPNHVFSFSEVFDGSRSFQQQFIRKDINNVDPGRIGGNRDVLDFPLYFAMRDNLTSNGLQNDWRNIKNASQDVQDDGLANNGSQGVAFVQSHDSGGAPPALSSVAYAYTLMRPGNALVYFNAKEFGNGRDFPADGRGDALGGLYGSAITKLVNIRNTHGRGNYQDRTPTNDQKEMLIYEREKSALVVLSNRGDGGFDSRTIQTAFAAGTPLIELTGNASDAVVDPFNDFPELLIVNGDSTVNLRVPRNKAPGASGATHNRGFFIYGLATPQGSLSLSNVSQTIAGETPTAATNGTARLSSLDVITADDFNVTLNTNAVTLLGIHRDRPADGDRALIRINGGLDLNGNGVVDNVNPSSTGYGFEAFTTLNSPGYDNASGNGQYIQAIDATTLPEGQNFITVRAYRQRSDGGTSVYTDFRKTVYIDRLKPESSVASFEPFNPANTENRDLIIRSDDKTADRVHVFLNLPETVTESSILSFVGQDNRAGDYDRDLFKYGFFGVQSGNNIATIVTYEISGNLNIQRVPGVFIANGRGLGLGDIDGNGTFTTADVANVANAFEQVLYSRNAQFNPAGDLNADGRVDNLDLFALPGLYQSQNAPAAVQVETRAMVLRRGDMNFIDGTNAADIDRLYSQRGATGDIWQFDLNVDQAVTNSDMDVLVRTILLTEYGDATLDRAINLDDFTALAASFGGAGGWANGDFNGDALVNLDDFTVLAANFGFTGAGDMPLPPGAFVARGAPVPEPASLSAMAAVAGLLSVRRRGRRLH